MKQINKYRIEAAANFTTALPRKSFETKNAVPKKR